MALGYYAGDYVSGNAAWSNGTGSVVAPGGDLYNGNIGAWTSRTRNDLSFLGRTATTDTIQGERYGYDQLNRLLSSSTLRGASSGNGAALQATSDYATSYGYDANGNLQSLSRNGSAQRGRQLAMDQLSYQYDPLKPNQLTGVQDAVTDQPYYDDIKQEAGRSYAGPGGAGTGPQYQYDALGNLVLDQTQGNYRQLEWNVYGKLAKVQSGT